MTNLDHDADQQKRIEQLRAEIQTLGGTCGADPDIPADLEEEFLKQVLEYERAQPITLVQLLENAGLVVSPPEELNDADFRSKLWEVIQRMSSMGAYLLNTNHLSDRELYEYLYNDGLREEATLFPENPSYAYMIDLTGSGSDEDMQVYLRYYADDSYRKKWALDWPNDPMPPHVDPPYDRDSRLPQSPIG